LKEEINPLEIWIALNQWVEDEARSNNHLNLMYGDSLLIFNIV
jgi:hypothetical protein